MRVTKSHGKESGFTLIELIAALVIIGTLSVYLSLRWSPDDSSLPTQADQLGRALRHAQALAMNQGRALTLDIQSASSYAITDGVATIRDPAGEQQAYTLVNGVTVSGNDLKFDSLGRPISGTNLVSAVQSWTLSGGSNTATVSVQPLTGFVLVTP
jgi:prepilin-type N-terminal cleavage/methylation domain-containing protein